MRTNFILVDYDNVQTVEQKALNKSDVRVIVFLGEKLASVKTPLVLQVQALGERGCFYQITGTGKNAMDLHIAFKVGQLSEKFPDASFHILSADGDFLPIVEHLKGKQVAASNGVKVAVPSVKQTAVKTVAQTSQERAAAVKKSLAKPKATKPGTLEKLANHVNTLSGQRLTKKQLDAIVAILKNESFIAVDGEKVSYAGLAEKT